MTRPAFLSLELVRSELCRGHEPVRATSRLHPEAVERLLPEDELDEPEDTDPAPAPVFEEP